jgi:excisionase family DNA binding protein
MPKEISGETFYSISEVAERLGVSLITVLDLIYEETLPAKKIEDEWLISEEALREFLEKQNLGVSE